MPVGMSVVTGATGHLGANLVRGLLDRGDTGVRVATIEPAHQEIPALAGLDVERVQADVRDRASISKALEGADVVYHLAARISIVARDAPDVWTVNHVGTRNVAAAALASGVRRLVHVSSIQTLAAGHVLDEDSVPIGSTGSPYDLSKLAGERAVLDAVEHGLDAVVCLPTGLLGPHDHEPSRAGRALSQVWRGRFPLSMTGGHDWVDARDVAAGLIAAAERGRTGRRYLLGGTWRSISDLARQAAALSGHHGPLATVPARVARPLAPVSERLAALVGVRPTFTPIALGTLAHHRGVDHGRARSELDYRPRPLFDTLRDTHAWWTTRSVQSGLNSSDRAGLKTMSNPTQIVFDHP